MQNTITKRGDFAYLKKYGRRIKGKAITLVKANPKKSISPLVGFIASKKAIGKAVKRNRAKRRLRSVWMENISLVDKDGMYLLIANYNTLAFSYEQLVKDFLFCIVKLHS